MRGKTGQVSTWLSVFSLSGSKLFCGWVCPLGALQEMIQRIPLRKKGLKRTLPFRVTNTVRVLVKDNGAFYLVRGMNGVG